jgi:hypothetical protein
MLGPRRTSEPGPRSLLPARPGGAPSRQGGRAFLSLALRPARAKRPEMAPERLETTESAPGNGDVTLYKVAR